MFEEEARKISNVIVYRFPFPQSKSVVFERTFRCPPNSPGYNNLAGLTKQRAEMVTLLSRCNSASQAAVYDQLATFADAYIPQITGLVNTLDSGGAVQLAKPLAFSWSSPLRTSGKWATFYTPDYEVCMTLHSRAALLVNSAEACSRSCDPNRFAELAPSAVRDLRRAAGIYEFISSSVLPRWGTAPEERPPETYSTICNALSSLALAAAQEFTVLKGALSGTSSGVLAKLQADAHRKYLDANAALAAKATSSEAAVGKDLRDFVNAMCGLSLAQTYKLAAIAANEAEKNGFAVTYSQVALESFNSAMKTGASTQLANWPNVTRVMREDFEHYARLYSKENGLVSYSKPVDRRMLEMPEAKAMITPLPFTLTPSTFSL